MSGGTGCQRVCGSRAGRCLCNVDTGDVFILGSHTSAYSSYCGSRKGEGMGLSLHVSLVESLDA